MSPLQAMAAPSAQDRAFIELQCAYRPHGGISRLQGLASIGPVRSDGREVDADGLVAEGRLFGFEWHHALWIPLFQIDQPGPAVAAAPQRVIAEFCGALDGWALASWFVQTNASLEDHCPIEWLRTRLPDVLEAARLDRFVAKA
jgi:hypothetical protein